MLMLFLFLFFVISFNFIFEIFKFSKNKKKHWNFNVLPFSKFTVSTLHFFSIFFLFTLKYNFVNNFGIYQLFGRIINWWKPFHPSVINSKDAAPTFRRKFNWFKGLYAECKVPYVKPVSAFDWNCQALEKY